jgi:N-acetylglucosaminyl-diphospho-decaprenol L-rhamnosyltransferase
VSEVTAVVVSFNTREDVLCCLGSLEANVTLPLRTIVVDNASADGSVEALRSRFPRAEVIANAENVGFARATNQGLRRARTPLILILNSDAEVRAGAVETMAAVLAQRPDVGIVGPRTLGTDGGPQVSFGRRLSILNELRQRRLVLGVRHRRPAALRRAEALAAVAREPAWVSGACMLARREVLEQVGYFDEAFFLYEEDVDLCLRVRRAGFKVAFAPEAVVVHHLGRSMAFDPERARLEYHRSHLLLYRKHQHRLALALLRGQLLLRAGAGWIAALGPGEPRRGRRRAAARTLALALRGP